MLSVAEKEAGTDMGGDACWDIEVVTLEPPHHTFLLGEIMNVVLAVEPFGAGVSIIGSRASCLMEAPHRNNERSWEQGSGASSGLLTIGEEESSSLMSTWSFGRSIPIVGRTIPKVN